MSPEGSNRIHSFTVTSEENEWISKYMALIFTLFNFFFHDAFLLSLAFAVCVSGVALLCRTTVSPHESHTGPVGCKAKSKRIPLPLHTFQDNVPLTCIYPPTVRLRYLPRTTGWELRWELRRSIAQTCDTRIFSLHFRRRFAFLSVCLAHFLFDFSFL